MRRYSKKAAKQRKLECYSFTKRLYRLLRSHPDRIDFQKLSRGVYGYYYDETEEIVIDYRRQIIPTLVHEALHHFHKDWSETRVYNEERRMMNSLTPRQIKNLIKVIATSF